jgi:hypothetical protein
MPASSAPSPHSPDGRHDPTHPPRGHRPARRSPTRQTTRHPREPLASLTTHRLSGAAGPTTVWVLPVPTADHPADVPADSGVGGVAAVVRRALVSLAPTNGPARLGHRIVIAHPTGPLPRTINGALHGIDSPGVGAPGPEAPRPETPGPGLPRAGEDMPRTPATPTLPVPDSIALDNGELNGVPSGSAVAVRPAVPDRDGIASGTAATGRTAPTADTESLGDSKAGVGLLVWDTTRTAARPLNEHDHHSHHSHHSAEDHDAGFIRRLAARLMPGGVLAVITASDHRAGLLRDSRPALIASARAAGLDYWQHIVTTTPGDNVQLDGSPHRTGPNDERHDDGGGGTGRRAEWRLVAEISVFCKPSTAHGHSEPVPGGRPTEPSQADTSTTEAQP